MQGEGRIVGDGNKYLDLGPLKESLNSTNKKYNYVDYLHYLSNFISSTLNRNGIELSNLGHQNLEY